jgi:hypothetical protein
MQRPGVAVLYEGNAAQISELNEPSSSRKRGSHQGCRGLKLACLGALLALRDSRFLGNDGALENDTVLWITINETVNQK